MTFIIRVTALLVMILSMAVLSNETSCYEYPMDKLSVMGVSDNDLSRYRFVVEMPGRLDKLMHHRVLLYRDGKLLSSNALECYRFRGTTGGYECYGECDSGGMIIGAHYEIRSSRGISSWGEENGGDKGWSVQWRTPGALVYPHKITCPPEIAQNIPTDKGYAPEYIKEQANISNFAYRDVCYLKKESRLVDGKWQPLYNDCEIFKDDCREWGMQKFGHYDTEKAAREALLRCQHSTPKDQSAKK